MTTLRVHSQRLVGSPMEPRACLAHHDAARGKTVVHTPTQGMHGMLGTLAAMSGWPAESIEVVAQDVGGSFGLRSGAASEQAVLMLAARTLGRPVKWVASRSELFIGEWHGRALTLEGSVALDAEGRILAIRFDDQVDLGAYSCYWAGFIGTRNLSVTMGGVYRVPALHMRSRLVYTNTVPVNAYRGAGRPDIAYAIERLIEQAAAEHGFDPIELRRRNFVPKDAFPYTTANGTVYDCGDFEGVLDKALGAGGLRGLRGPARRGGPPRAPARHRLGLLPRSLGRGRRAEGPGLLRVRCRRRDRAVRRDRSVGPGARDFVRADRGRRPGPARSNIHYRASDPAHALVGNGTGGSRSLYGAGSAFKNLVPRIIEQGRPHAAAALGVDADALEYRDGGYCVSGAAGDGKRIALPDLARQLAGPQPHPLDCDADSVSGVTFPNGCHIAEVEIDPQTGSTQVVAYTAVDDLGHVVSPQLVQGQVHGGVVQGVGQAFGEQAIYDDESGQLLTGSFTDYAMPHVGCIENVRTDYHPVPTALNALGAKGVGESGCSGSLPALANAMMSALRPLGVPPMDMPFTPARVWAALRDARARGTER